MSGHAPGKQETTRRAMLRGTAAASVGAVAGAALAGMPAAHAAVNDPVLMGHDNNAGSSMTVVRSTTNSTTFVASSDGASGAALKAVVTHGSGSAIVASNNSATSTNPVVQATSIGEGFALYGLASGTGKAVAGYVASTASSATAVYGSTAGNGVGVEGRSSNGRGGRFAGRFAQINLAPGNSTTHPSHGGILGDLYVDQNARLWFCRGANAWVQVV